MVVVLAWKNGRHRQRRSNSYHSPMGAKSSATTPTAATAVAAMRHSMLLPFRPRALLMLMMILRRVRVLMLVMVRVVDIASLSLSRLIQVHRLKVGTG